MFGKTPSIGRCFGDQYLYVIGDLATLSAPQLDANDPLVFPADITTSLMARTALPPKSAVVWGGASKGVIYALLRERVEAPVAAVVDINPYKQGRYLAATGLRVSALEEVLPDLTSESRILIMNPNYSAEIRKMSNNAFTYIEVGND